MIKVPCKITPVGDEDYARNFVGAAQSQLRILENQLEFRNLKQGVRKVRLNQRTTVEARICFNLKEIIIYCMPIFDEGREGFDEVGFCILAGLVFPSSINGRILRSVNFGKTWKQLDDLDPDHVNQVHLINLGYLENGICLAGSAYHGFLFRSTDYGQNWTYKDLPVDEMVIFSPTYLEEGICLAGTRPGGFILRSTDFGISWVNLGQMAGESKIPAITYLEEEICLAGTAQHGHILRSTDLGLTWTDLGQQVGTVAEGGDINSLVYLGNGICLAGGKSWAEWADMRILRSTDYGETWTDLGQIPGWTITALIYLGNGICLAGDSAFFGKIYRSTDYGLTWTDLGQQAGELGIPALVHIKDDICLAGTGDNAKILKSVDSGLTWEDLGSQYEGKYIWSLVAFEDKIKKEYK